MPEAGRREIIRRTKGQSTCARNNRPSRTETKCKSAEKAGSYNLRLVRQPRRELVEIHVARPDAASINELACHIARKQRALIRFRQPSHQRLVSGLVEKRTWNRRTQYTLARMLIIKQRARLELVLQVGDGLTELVRDDAVWFRPTQPLVLGSDAAEFESRDLRGAGLDFLNVRLVEVWRA